MNDEQAVIKLKRGDMKALGVLVERYQVRALRAAYLITQDTALAEDVVQDAYVNAYRSIASFDSNRPFSPWLMRIVINGAIKASRQSQTDLNMPDEDADTDYTSYLLDPAPGPDDLLESAETEEAIWQALGLLSPERRAVIVMRLYLEMSETEVAERLNIPVGTIKSRLFAAKQQLRSLLHTERRVRYER